jgi:hypothetical protein
VSEAIAWSDKVDISHAAHSGRLLAEKHKPESITQAHATIGHPIFGPLEQRKKGTAIMSSKVVAFLLGRSGTPQRRKRDAIFSLYLGGSPFDSGFCAMDRTHNYRGI